MHILQINRFDFTKYIKYTSKFLNKKYVSNRPSILFKTSRTEASLPRVNYFTALSNHTFQSQNTDSPYRMEFIFFNVLSIENSEVHQHNNKH